MSGIYREASLLKYTTWKLHELSIPHPFILLLALFLLKLNKCLQRTDIQSHLRTDKCLVPKKIKVEESYFTKFRLYSHPWTNHQNSEWDQFIHILQSGWEKGDKPTITGWGEGCHLTTEKPFNWAREDLYFEVVTRWLTKVLIFILWILSHQRNQCRHFNVSDSNVFKRKKII